MRTPDARSLLFALPTLTVGVVAFALFGAGAEQPVRAARIYGGPTGAPQQSFRLELVDSFKGVQAPVPGARVHLALRGPEGHEAFWSGAVGPDGVAEVAPPALPPAERYELSVFEAERVLAEGRIQLGAPAWLASASRRGGWQVLKLDDTTQIELAPARGALAVPFTADLLLQVRRDGELVPARLELSADGAELSQSLVQTGPNPARVGVTPRDHQVGVRVRLLGAGAPERVVAAALPVVPGALEAKLDGQLLTVSSPVPRERAYYTLVTEQRRIGGGSLALSPDAGGAASGSARLGPLPDERLWVVVASSADLVSAARVGWPVGKYFEPATTLDVPERLLLDGLPRALSRESARRKRLRFVAAGVCGLSLLLGAVLLVARTRRAQRALGAHFERSGLGADERRWLSPRRSAWTVAALLALALGFLVLAVFALLVER